MRPAVVTSFSPEGFVRYGQRFLDTFALYWPEDVRLLVYWEGDNQPPGVEGFDLLSLEPCRSFLSRHAGNPIVAGKKPDPRWKWGPKATARGENFRFDAYKFARKVFAIAHAARQVERGKLFWADADIITRAFVPGWFLDDLLPDGVSLCYLKRDGYHSECGFVGYNLDRLETHAFLTAFEDVYREDRFFDIPEWHDSFVFDWLVERYRPAAKHIKHSSRGQPFDHSPLARYMTHLKGRRKNA